MNAHNDLIETRLARAIVAVKHLDKLGCTVVNVDVQKTTPVLEIDGCNSRFLKGAMRSRIVIGGVAHYVMVASVCDCVAQWRESFDVGTPAREAHA